MAPAFRRLLRLALALGLVAVVALACRPAPPGGAGGGPGAGGAGAPVVPRLLGSIPLPGGPTGFVDAGMISPDGRWAAIVGTYGPEKHEVRIGPLAGGEGRTVAEIAVERLEAGTLLLRPLGWTPAGDFVFARQGTQPDGDHGGQRGVSLRVVAPEAGDAREVAWLPVSTGYVKQLFPVNAAKDVFVYVNQAIWRLPTGGGGPAVVKEGLPNQDFLWPEQAADGRHFVYQVWGPEEGGIYVLDAATGSETRLAPPGETLSFGAQWSPDGRLLAYYEAGKKGDGSGDYDILSGEDAPLPVAGAVVVVQPDGRPVARLTVPGVRLAGFAWSQDSSHLAFATGKDADAAASPWRFEWQALWTADLEGRVTRVADLAGAFPELLILHVGAGGRDVHYLTFSDSTNALWWARSGEEPARLEPPAGTASPWMLDTVPALAWGEALFLSCDTPTVRQLVQIQGDSVTTLAAGGMESYFSGISGGRLLAYTVQDQKTGEVRLMVLELTH